MRAVILAGGQGTRLKPFTVVIPKPLVPIGEMPILELLIRQLKAQGFERVTLSVGYLASLIEAYCGDGSRWDIRIDYLQETDPRNGRLCSTSRGRPALARRATDLVWVVSERRARRGDVCTNIR
jgi:NDP-sugar pyrophosphorylase family protein